MKHDPTIIEYARYLTAAERERLEGIDILEAARREARFYRQIGRGLVMLSAFMTGAGLTLLTFWAIS